MKSMPSDQARYFIAIIPPSPVYEEAFKLKNYFKEQYHSKASLNSPPHITLHMPFLWEEKNEADLVTSLNSFCQGKNPFPLELSGFDAFVPRVIFISVKLNEPLDQFQNQLLQFCKAELHLSNARPNDQGFHPHLTLAFRDLKKEMFIQAWEEFKGRKLYASFIADRISLLKHDGKAWQPVHYFAFKS